MINHATADIPNTSLKSVESLNNLLKSLIDPFVLTVKHSFDTPKSSINCLPQRFVGNVGVRNFLPHTISIIADR